MRLLHTSDWHLGRSFHREGMLAHQAAFIDHLVDVVTSEAVDLVVLAGDVYDRALPPADAVRLADDAFTRLAGTGARVIVTSGNHDSALRLGYGSRLLDQAGLHVRTDAALACDPVRLRDDHGPIAVYALPYLDPEAVREPWALAVRSHQVAMSEALTRVRADLARRRQRSVVMAHAFVAGGEPSESERDISVGGVSRVALSTFEGIDYVALGHLHRAQALTDRVRYSGSPLAYSFSEAGQVKGSWLVDLDEAGAVAAEFIPAPVPRPIARLRGEIEQLLTAPDLAIHEDSWLHITLTDSQRPKRAMERLHTRFPHTLQLSFEPTGVQPVAEASVRTAGLSDLEIACAFVGELRGSEPTPDERRLLQRAIDAAKVDRDADPLPRSVSDHPSPLTVTSAGR